MSQVTTHVLDTAAGRPADGVAVTLERDGRVVATRHDRRRRPHRRPRPGPARPGDLPAALRHRRAAAPLLPRGRGRLRRRGRRPPARAAAAEPARLHDVPGELTMGIVLGRQPLRQGGDPRVPGRARHRPARHPRPQRVRPRCSGDFAAAHVDGDQAHVLPTDTQKNTVFAFAKPVGIGEIEEFGARARPALRRRRRAGDRRRGAHRGVRLGADRRPRPRLPPAGSEVRTTARRGRRRTAAHVVSGIRDLVVLKSTGSEFAGFLVDEFTTLRRTHDRVLATSLTARWTYADGTADPGADWAASYAAVAARPAGAVRRRALAGAPAVPVGDGPGGPRGAAGGGVRSSWSRRTSTTSPSTSARSAWTTPARCST